MLGRTNFLADSKAMAKCPACENKFAYGRAMMLRGKKAIRCGECSTELSIDHKKMFFFYLVFNGIAALFGLILGLSGEYLVLIGVVTIWIVIMMSIYPVVLKLKMAVKN
jgi:CXXC-20-CXXC protein